MPYHSSWRPVPSVVIAEWRLDDAETDAVLKKGLELSTDEFITLARIRHPLRRRQWLAARRLAYRILHLPPIRYLGSGCPVVGDGFLSIAHSGRHVVVAASAHPVGVDVERVSSQVVRLADRFTRPEEAALFGGRMPEAEALTLLWSIKEAAYKATGGRTPQFRSHISVVDWRPPHIIVEASVNRRPYRLWGQAITFGSMALAVLYPPAETAPPA